MNVNDVELALYSKLNGTSALTTLLASATAIYNHQAPQGATFDYVVFGQQAGGDENKSGHRALNLVYLIKAISLTSLKTAGDVDHQVDVALHTATLTLANSLVSFVNFWLRREGTIRYTETLPDGRRAFHAGGLYRLRLAN